MTYHLQQAAEEKQTPSSSQLLTAQQYKLKSNSTNNQFESSLAKLVQIHHEST